jgi:Asp-tRNA(Asn)/Glu-tRNA(Gln) amidotransferase A subunit family amidase
VRNVGLTCDPDGHPLLSFQKIVPAFMARTDTPRDFLERCIARIAENEPRVHAFAHIIDFDEARRQADMSSQRYCARSPLSPIDGLPIGVKDLYSTADMPTQMGSPIYKGYCPASDCAAVFALRKAGAIILGKTVTTEFGFYEPGPTRNPWDLERTPGGSSSGSAACVAARMIPAAIGGQAMGSLLRPASFCGVVGFKPGLGALNRAGSPGTTLSQAVMGVFAGTVEDAWTVAHEISSIGGDAGYLGLIGPQILSGALRPTRLARIAAAQWDLASEAARVAFDQSINRLEVEGIEIIDRSDDDRIKNLEDAISDARDIGDTICGYELRWQLNEYEIRCPGLLSAEMSMRLGEWNRLTSQQYTRAVARRAESRKALAALRGLVDGLVSLAAPGAAPKGLKSTGDPRFAVASSVLGAPAFSLPILAQERMPLGLQLIGFPDYEEGLARHALWVMRQFAIA